jgi:AcrR family transcriptional regulator
MCFKRLLDYLYMSPAKADQRREAGLRTRARLLDAALNLLAERGEDGVTLRTLTDAADANLAAVSYHFGSLKGLCDAAVEHALERYLDAQEEAVDALGPDSTLEEAAAAFARPVMHALAVGGRDLAVMRIVARAGIDPPPGWERFDTRFDQIRRAVFGVAKSNTPAAKDAEVIFRIRSAAGLLNWLVLAPVGAELRNKSAKKIERRLVPVVAGTLSGTSSG